jgi:rod shape-determining protein MreD
VLSFAALAAPALIAMLLQTTVLPATHLPVVPDLILVLTVYLGIRHPSAAAAAGAFLLGYFLDTFSGTVLGMNAFSLSVAYAAAHLISRRIWMEGGFPVIAVVFVAGCVRAVAEVVVATLVAARAPVWQHVVRYGFLEAAVAALVAPAVFAWMSWEKRIVGAA